MNVEHLSPVPRRHLILASRAAAGPAGRYLARPHFRLRQGVDGRDAAAVKSAPPGADSVALVLHGWGRGNHNIWWGPSLN